MKKNYRKLILSFLILFVFIGVTYAYIRFEAEQKDVNAIASLCLKVSLEEQAGSDIKLTEAFPITDIEGKKLSPYVFTITNKCDTGILYEVNLDILSDINDNNTLGLSYIKYMLNDDEPGILNDRETVSKTNKDAFTSKQLKTAELRGKESITYKLRLWMDYDTTIEEGSNKTFKSKIAIKAVSKNYSYDGDVVLSVYVDDKSVSEAPSKGAYDVSVDCKGTGKGTWNYDEWGAVITGFQSGEKCDVNFKSRKYLSDYIIAQSETESTIEHITQASTIQTGSNATEEYRYVGESSSVNNWVYFGCDSNCTEDNLYRLIGVIPTQKEVGGKYENRVKLVKASYYTETESGYLKDGYGYGWNTDGTNNWEYSKTQINVLNGVYWKSLSEYQKYIDQTVWYLGAVGNGANDNSYASLTTKQFYQYERGSIKAGSGGILQYTNYIGLMYPSDYGFSISSNYWNAAVDSNSSIYMTSNAWLYPTFSPGVAREWLITPDGGTLSDYDNSTLAYNIYRSPNPTLYMEPLYRHWVNVNSTGYIRPTFNLKANVMYKSGDGTSSNPYRIEIN